MRAGHQVVLHAGSRDTGIAMVPSLGLFGVQVAIVDGNLTPRGTSGTDGAEITSAIREAHPHITVIGHSASGEVFGAHKNVPPQEPFEVLARAVRES